MTDSISLPAGWVEETARRAAAQLRPEIALSLYYRERWDYPDCTETAVVADLEAGAWISTYKGRDRYLLGGDKYKIVLQFDSGTRTGRALAKVQRIDLYDGVPPKSRMRPSVRFVSVKEEVFCNLKAIAREFNNAQNVRARLTDPQPVRHLQRQSDLERRTEVAYRLLWTQFGLLKSHWDGKERWKSQGRLTTEPELGIVCPGDRDIPKLETLWIRAGGGKSVRARVAEVAGDTILLEPDTNMPWPNGTAVEVEEHLRYPYQANRESVQRLLARECAGHWDDLAALLSRPGSLRARRSAPEPAMFYCDSDGDRLDAHQRAAVTGAVVSPHAYFIQGPPGTGKTAVISELVRQLHRIGERVLLLAPSNAAVDEVLSRVGDKPGVHALRVTWREDRVDPDLHPYLFDRIGHDLTRRLSRTEGGRRASWTARETQATQAIENLQEIAAAIRDGQEARTDLREAEARLERIRDDAARSIDARESEISVIRAASERTERTAATAVSEAAAADDLLTQFDATLQDQIRTVRAVLDPLRQQVSTLDRLQAAEQREQTLLHELDERVGHETARLDAHWRLSEERWERVTAWRTDYLTRLTALRNQRVGRIRAVLRDRKIRRAENVIRDLDAQLAAFRFEDRHAMTASVELHETRTEAAGLRERQTDRMRQMANAKAQFHSLSKELADRLRELGGEEQGRPPVLDRYWSLWSHHCRRIETQLEALLGNAPTGPRMPKEHWNFEPLVRRRSQLTRAASEAHAYAAQSVEAQVRAGAALHEIVATLKAERTAFTAEFDECAGVIADARKQVSIAERVLMERAGGTPPTGDALRERIEAHTDERDRLRAYQRLRADWEQMLAEVGPDGVAENVRDAFVRGTNLVCATTAGIVGSGSDPVAALDFDTLILDESSRVTDSEFLIGALRSRRWVLVGDECQLPPHVDRDDEQHLHALAAIKRLGRKGFDTLEAAVESLSGTWDDDDEELRQIRVEEVQEAAQALLDTGTWEAEYRDRLTKVKTTDFLRGMKTQFVQSFFARAVAQVEDRLRTRLLVQRRMAPALSKVVREPVYRGDYLDPDDGRQPVPLTTDTFKSPVTLVDTTSHRSHGNDEIQGFGFINPLEADAVKWALRTYDRELALAGSPERTFSVLSFYSAQAKHIEQKLQGFRPKVLRRKVIGPIDAIQGQQADLILISFVRRAGVAPRSTYGRWLQDLRRLNVACTRARQALMLIGNRRTLERLNGVSEAEVFYRHLFGLFNGADPDYGVVRGFQR
ncbi:AAA domain-containing protein [Glycomyces sp. NPDC046736]|uniref:DEAD/DEAH box helicase n=1 Tax=Glycomyces sp. NPDC046736 TaxID=3155615 RepID=UPI0033D1E4A6